MSKVKKKIEVLIITICMILLSFCITKVDARDFCDEAYWIKACSTYQTSNQILYNDCLAFQAYVQEKANDSSSALSLQAEINKAQGDISKLTTLSREYQKKIDEKQININALQDGINTAQNSIEKAEKDIDKK